MRIDDFFSYSLTLPSCLQNCQEEIRARSLGFFSCPDSIVFDSARCRLFSLFVYRVKDFFFQSYMNLKSWFVYLACFRFLTQQGSSESFIIGSFSQTNAVRRGVIRSSQVGSRACCYIATQAIAQYLREGIDNSPTIDLIVFKGLLTSLLHYGIDIPIEILCEENPSRGIELLQRLVYEMDESPSALDFYLSRATDREWEEIRAAFIGELEAVFGWNNPEQIQLLCQNGSTDQELIYRECLEHLIRLVPGRKIGGLLIAPPSTFALLIEKEEGGNVQEISFFDSHGILDIEKPELALSAYIRKWKRGPANEEPIEMAAHHLARIISSERFMITPLQLRRSSHEPYSSIQ